MWTEKSKDHFRLCAYYTDPLTGQRHKIGVTYYKNTNQARNKAKTELDSLIAKKDRIYPREHEPVNPDRSLSHISTKDSQTKDMDQESVNLPTVFENSRRLFG